MRERRRPLKPPKPVTVSSELRKRLEALPPAGLRQQCPLDEEGKKLLLEFWPLKRHKLVAQELGICHTTALHWYRLLTEKKT